MTAMAEKGDGSTSGDGDEGGEACKSDGLICRHPGHPRSINALRFRGETYRAGCPDGSTFVPLEYSEVFSRPVFSWVQDNDRIGIKN